MNLFKFIAYCFEIVAVFVKVPCGPLKFKRPYALGSVTKWVDLLAGRGNLKFALRWRRPGFLGNSSSDDGRTSNARLVFSAM